MPLLIMNTFAALALIHASCLTLTRLKTDAETSVHHYQQTTQLYNGPWQFSYRSLPPSKVGEMRKASEGGSQTTGQPGRLTFDAVEAGC